jgi:hypothetical protein
MSKIRRRAAVAAKALNECTNITDLKLLGYDIARMQLNKDELYGLRREYQYVRAIILNLHSAKPYMI